MSAGGAWGLLVAIVLLFACLGAARNARRRQRRAADPHLAVLEDIRWSVGMIGLAVWLCMFFAGCGGFLVVAGVAHLGAHH